MKKKKHIFFTININFQEDVVVSRQRARQIAELFRFSPQEQTKIATAVSEITRNVVLYAGSGKAEFFVDTIGSQNFLIIRVTDNGPGIEKLEKIMRGDYYSKRGMGTGISGSKKLMDYFEIETKPGRGTTVTMGKKLPPVFVPLDEEFEKISKRLRELGPVNPFDEIKMQNLELMKLLEEMSEKNRELEDTNRAISSLYAEVNDKAGELERANRLTMEFISYVSHEIRTPLSSIIMLSKSLLNNFPEQKGFGQIANEVVKKIGLIRKSAEELLELANGLLDLTRIEAGKLEVVPVIFDIEELFSTLRGLLKPIAGNKKVELIFEKKGHIPRLYTDLNKLSQILRNLLSNALKFTPEGKVTVTAGYGGGKVIFTVTDTGKGIRKEDQNEIFKEYFRRNTPKDRGHPAPGGSHALSEGQGLGLPISRKLARLLGGELKLESSVLGKGSSFQLILPVKFTGLKRERI